MSRTKKKDQEKSSEQEGYKIRFIGTAAETTVISFPNGKGYFLKGMPYTFIETEEIEAAKQLVKDNVNFEEVRS